MAIKIGKANSSFKMYKGVGSFYVAAINPSKEELGKLQGREITEDIVYTGKNDEGKDTMRLVFYLKSNVEANNGIDLLVPLTFNLTKVQKIGTNSSKVQVIDKYGRTAWATVEEIKNKSIPQYANGPANIDADYRAAFDGEENLVKFLQTWLNIPNCMNYINNKWVMKDDASDSEISLDVNDVFGELKEIKELVNLVASYAVKVAVGIKTTDKGKQYHNVFNRAFAKNAVSDYSKLGTAIQEFKNNGGAANIDYSVEPLHENVVEETKFQETTSDMPFGEPEGMPW